MRSTFIAIFLIIAFAMAQSGVALRTHTLSASFAPFFNAADFEIWPSNGGYPSFIAVHWKASALCVHITSTCAGHVCGPECQSSPVSIGPYDSRDFEYHLPFCSVKTSDITGCFHLEGGFPQQWSAEDYRRIAAGLGRKI